ncbi:Internal alternative NAD(P)H-ubiquinone oxidoreductase A1, mitochondrial, partial [Linum grandiflorum]
YLEQVAERQGKYLAGLLNRIGKAGGGRANSGAEVDLGKPFVYKHLGSMATLGRYKALVDLRQSKEGKGISMAGFVSWFIWRSAYLTRVISWRNRFYVAVNWLTTMVFGRDISRI